MKRNDVIALIVVIFLIGILTRSLKQDGNWKYLKTLRPDVRPIFISFLNDIKKMGGDPEIISSHRTTAQQAYYKKQDKRNASPGHSTHEHDTGIDLRIHAPSGKILNKQTPKATWMATGIPALAKKYGMRWGGDFKGYPDNNHFDFLL